MYSVTLSSTMLPHKSKSRRTGLSWRLERTARNPGSRIRLMRRTRRCSRHSPLHRARAKALAPRLPMAFPDRSNAASAHPLWMAAAMNSVPASRKSLLPSCNTRIVGLWASPWPRARAPSAPIWLSLSESLCARSLHWSHFWIGTQPASPIKLEERLSSCRCAWPTKPVARFATPSSDRSLFLKSSARKPPLDSSPRPRVSPSGGIKKWPRRSNLSSWSFSVSSRAI
mmetsp:Transcript_14252/g.39320  ORF Transcript_14252/g.39320 Transcript_14252/m.39320 type:complete len:227 (+) Transcript_14252:447-1127(+)